MSPLLAVSVVLFAFRLYAASRIGFGDSEALYASYALHPQPAYLDHPGLVGMAFRAIGSTPGQVHVVTTFAATLVPWLAYAAARALGAERERAALAAAVLAVTPEIAVGLYALTPDLLLAPLWLGAIALAGIALRGDERETRAAASFVGAGLLAGIACSAKVSGLLLVLALAITYAREKKRSIWPWAGLAIGLVVFLPVVVFEARTGWPMLRHRLVDSALPGGGGVRIVRNLGALVGGQLVYVSPVLMWIAYVVARDLVRRRDEDAESRLLFHAFAVPLVPLVALSVFSAGSEPHWIAPALLALPLHAARRPIVSRRLVLAGAGVAGALTLAAHVWVLVPSSGSVLPRDIDPRADIASELYGWPRAIDAIRDLRRTQATPLDPDGSEVVVVGPHWTVCAQIQAGMPDTKVGCATPIRDDFDDWLPRSAWKKADKVIFVTDNRFGGDGADLLPEHVAVSNARVSVIRGGRVARVFHLVLYDRRASGMLRRHAEERQALHEAREDDDATDHVADPGRRTARLDDDAVAE